MYVCMSLSDKLIMNISYGGMIAYVGEKHEEVPDLTRNQLGRVAPTNL